MPSVAVAIQAYKKYLVSVYRTVLDLSEKFGLSGDLATVAGTTAKKVRSERIPPRPAEENCE
jgi:hypothetical protein